MIDGVPRNRSKFLRKKTVFNRVDYSRKTSCINEQFKSKSFKHKDPLSFTKKHNSDSLVPYPDIPYFSVGEPEKTSKVQASANKRIIALNEFGFIPQDSIRYKKTITSSKITKSSIRLSELMGKNNTQKILKDLEIRNIINQESTNSHEETKKFNSVDKEKYLKASFRKSRLLSDISKNIHTSNGYLNIEKHKKSLDKINLIYSSCDNFLQESKSTKNISHYLN